MDNQELQQPTPWVEPVARLMGQLRTMSTRIR